MHVIKRNGVKENVKYDKIANRIKKQTYGLNSEFVDFYDVSQQVIGGMKDGMTTAEIDQYAAETAAMMTTTHPDYSILASRIAITSLHKDTPISFSECINVLYNEGNGQISEEVFNIVNDNKLKLDNAIIKDRDYDIDYFGFRTLERSYLLKLNGKVIETPQHMWMRVAIGIYKSDIKSAIAIYDSMSKGYYTHASPTLFNAATKRPQLSSCFLVAMKEDSIEGIFDTIKDVALISKWSGGVGIHVHNLRSNGSRIQGTGGESSGYVSWIKVLNETARGVNQGGKRKGAFAIYSEPWHADIFDFLDLKKNHGKEEMRARDLFYALWINDLFMERVEADIHWTLMDPNECPGLSDVYGDDFNKLYTQYEEEGRGTKIKARTLWTKILDSQIETGNPYMLYKDAANRKSNQKNLGTVKSSNLCTEIIEYSSKDETAVCNLGSIALPKYIIIPQGRKLSKDKTKRTFDFDKLREYSYQLTVNLNNVIDVNFYPIESAKRSNMRHRPIGIGVQGLADTFALLGYPFESEPAKKLNKQIFETIYYGALEASCDLAKKHGTYVSYEGSPISQGILQYDMWDIDQSTLTMDWTSLKKKIKKYGVRNSLLMAPMPTASCIIRDTPIKTNDGIKTYTDILEENKIDYKFIEEMGEQRWVDLNPFKVPTRLGERGVERIFYNGKVPTLDIELGDGNIISCSYNHKFLVIRDGINVWVRADELLSDDELVCE